ncbi:hypothetical protein BLNAU_15280 [Blattamonas nauphoetae]|uniref:Right handed beta helix domain-containing protein n=1 Tax=Blattamonas nauphoetae TaxID=2049346 RepID=A0ABQ9XBE0_9EUKA|nr:hypothetical protein BLNAU_15280 [Blattamonas nauphoetae]
MVESTTLDLFGNKTKIMHMETRTEASKPDLSVEYQNRIEAETPTNTMFLFSNSTISLWNVFLDSSRTGTTVGRLWSSYLTVVRNQIISNAECSPFVIVGGGNGRGSSVRVIDSVHESCDAGVLLPLVWERSSEWEKWKDTEREGWGDVGSNFVSGSGLEVKNVHLIVGSGPLFGGLEESINASEMQSFEVETRLVGSLIWNTTSRVGDAEGVRAGGSGGLGRVVVGIAEGIVGSDVQESTNHLSGTAIGGMDVGGSVLSHNTSFTRCHTPSSQNADTNTRLNKHYKNRFIVTSGTTLNHKFSLCTFKKCTSSNQGGAMYAARAGFNIQIERCSFHNCTSTSDAGAVYINSVDGTFSLSSSIFIGCSAERYGGSVVMRNLTAVSISRCAFLDATAGDCGAGNCRQTYTTNSSLGGGAVRFQIIQVIEWARA